MIKDKVTVNGREFKVTSCSINAFCNCKRYRLKYSNDMSRVVVLEFELNHDIRRVEVMSSIVEVLFNLDGSYDSYCNLIGYVHPMTREEAYKRKIEMIAEHNGDWKPNWNNHNQQKWFSLYNSTNDNIELRWTGYQRYFHYKEYMKDNELKENPEFQRVCKIVLGIGEGN
jgi:hypothetical protein